MYNIGLNRNGEPISNIYNSVLEQHSEKTRNVIKVLGMSNDQVAEAVKDTLSNITANELNKMLTLKGMKKSEINQIIEKNRIA